MVVSIGTISSAAQGVSYFERDGYYAKDDPQHREVSAWAGKGAEALGLSGPSMPTRSGTSWKARCRTDRDGASGGRGRTGPWSTVPDGT